MALKHLLTKEMVSLSRTMVDPAHQDYRALMKLPMLAVCLPKLEAAHAELLRVHLRVDYTQAIQELVDAQAEVDNGHDDKIRGIWHRLQSEAFLAKNPEVAELFRKLCDWLIPEGLATVNLSYRAEVGHAEMISEQLSATQKSLLERLPTYQGDMLAEVQGWLALADELGRLEHQRSGIEVRGEGRGINLKARGQWIRIVDHMRRAASFERDDAAIDEIFGGIDRAERTAEARVERKRSGEDEEPDTEPTEEPDTTTESTPEASATAALTPPAPSPDSSQLDTRDQATSS